MQHTLSKLLLLSLIALFVACSDEEPEPKMFQVGEQGCVNDAECVPWAVCTGSGVCVHSQDGCISLHDQDGCVTSGCNTDGQLLEMTFYTYSDAGCTETDAGPHCFLGDTVVTQDPAGYWRTGPEGDIEVLRTEQSPGDLSDYSSCESTPHPACACLGLPPI